METWLANMLHIEEHNFEYALGRKTYSLGMNHYGDMTSDEFAKTYNGFLNSKKEMLPSHEKSENFDRKCHKIWILVIKTNETEKIFCRKWADFGDFRRNWLFFNF